MASRQLATFQQSNHANTKVRSDVLLLRSSNHDQSSPQDPFALLSDRVCNRSVQWNSTFRVCGEFSYTEFYWEWLEDVLNRSSDRIRDTSLYKAVYASLFSYDRVAPVIRAFCKYWCPTTNTLHTSQGEMSISLWDLDRVGGLPIKGRFYDEVVPEVEDFATTNKNGDLFLPSCCRHLFLAYHNLRKEVKGKQGVKITAWIRYWYKGSKRYQRPPRKITRDRNAPKETYNPSGTLLGLQKRTSKELEVFEDLQVADEDVESTYLAAFLACWLCLFVLPEDDTGLIRPAVLKVVRKNQPHKHQAQQLMSQAHS